MNSDRRQFLIHSGAWLGLTSIGRVERIVAAPRLKSNPFTLGSASGDPTSDGVVLWTRLAPEPLAGGGMGSETIEVDWVLAEDEKLSRGVKRGKALASANLGHSVHVEMRGLRPGRWYWYQFRAGGYETPVARTRTAPAASDRLRFAFASCQHYETGLYTAYQHMAEEDLDLVVHLGDYIYEGKAQDRVRRHNSGEIVTLNDYRNRHALYKTDPLLQRTHARFPWIVTWDDHEVDNDYANDSPEDSQPRQSFLERRANAYQAYYEHMPLRRASLPSGSNMQLYRRLAFGNLAEFFVLDTRQYRSNQPCGAGTKALCPQTSAAAQTILGKAQREWLFAGLPASRARWNVLGNQVPVAQIDMKAGVEEAFSMDKWNGYHGERQSLLRFLRERKIANTVVITGDVHSNWTVDLREDYRSVATPAVATEFVGTSISSSGDGMDITDAVKGILSENPQVRFYNGQRGYVSCTVDAKTWRSDYRIVPFVSRPGAPLQTRISFVVEQGRPGAQKA
jgi:alkaline phosphatase D